MAKKPSSRRRRRRYLRGAIQHGLDLGTLAANTLVGSVIAGAVTEKAWLSSIVGTWGLADFTAGAGDGPILVGIAHSDYSDAEIEAWIENNASWDEGDLTAQEVAKRKIRQVGSFDSTTAGTFEVLTLNDGKPIKTKCNFYLQTGESIRVWAYNQGDSAIGTTDPDLNLFGHANLWPVS